MKKLFRILAVVLMGITTTAPTFAATTQVNMNQIDDLNITAKSAIAMDEETGQILYQKDANTRRPIASMSKIIATYLIMQSVENNQMSWNQKVSISKSLEKVSENMELTNVPLSSEHQYTVKNLLDASLIYSANAAILALGKAQAGSSQKFVDEMRQTVKDWGIKDAKLYNAAGLLENQVGDEKYPGTKGDVENQMSARDMAIVIQHVLKKYPSILKITNIQKTNFNTGDGSVEIVNHNELLKGGAQYDANYQIDGLKTGTSEAAGEDFSATGYLKKRRIVSVVLGSQTGKRFTDTKVIWQNLKNQMQVKTTQLSGKYSIEINSAKEKDVKLRLAKPLSYWQKVNKTTPIKLTNIHLKNKQVKAPLLKTQTVAQAALSTSGMQFIEGDPNEKLVPTKSISKANWLVRIGRSIADMFH